MSTKVDIKTEGGDRLVKNRLKEVRKDRGISRLKLSEMSGISRTTLTKIENNEEVNVNTRTIAKLAEVLGVKPSEIFMF